MHSIELSNLEKLARSRHILLLQGPIGNFFWQLMHWLKTCGAQVYKINFNGGDCLFYPDVQPNTYSYRSTLSEFEDYLSELITQNSIDAVVCFGDTRAYHRIAKKVCCKQNVRFWVFEEGYFRPYWITLEEDGVNAFSPLPRNAAWFQAALPHLKQRVYQAPKPVRSGFIPMAWIAIRYYFAMFCAWRRFPNYKHHRSANIRYYSQAWMRSAWRRVWFSVSEAWTIYRVRHKLLGKYFILPLQVSTDSQIKVHSHYASMRDCLHHVMASFAIHAPEDTKLVVKHHPMDRGFVNYHRDIQAFLRTHPKMRGRILYVHDVPLPYLLRSGIGMVTVNSTSGLSALIHGMPVKILGEANYNIAGITSQKSLSKFWSQPDKPNAAKFHAYRMYHLNNTQINGSFYTEVRLPENVGEGVQAACNHC